MRPLGSEGARGRAGDVRRLSVKPLRGHSPMELPAVFLEAPADGALLPAHAVMVAGWVVGDGSAASAIEFEHEGEVVWRAPVGREREDVAKAFSSSEVGKPGFQTTLNACDLPLGAQVMVFGVFADGKRTPICELTLSDSGEDGGAGGDG
jgi:hypothetical protein